MKKSPWPIAVAVLSLTGEASGAASAKPQLLVVGAPHFGISGSHVVKDEVPNVLTPERQREIETVIDALAAFRPTRVAIEWPADEQDRLDQRYAQYRAGRYTLSASERDQLGLRLAARLNLPRVYAVDWNGEPPGGSSHYNYPAWAKENGRGDEWQAWVDRAQKEADARAQLMHCTSVSEWLRSRNTPSYRAVDHRVYYDIAQVGELIGPNPGAAWVGQWYTRNLRILNNLRAIASNKNDRVVVIYGSGHGYLLDQQARESEAFEVVDTLAHLPEQQTVSGTTCPA